MSVRENSLRSTSRPRRASVSPAALAAALLAAIAFAGASSTPAAAATETWKVDTSHSNCLFKVRHFFSQVTGAFTDFAGTVNYDQAAPEKSSVEIVVQTASIDTDNEKRDGHLKSDDFFNAEKFPTITFKSTGITKSSKANHWDVAGDLTIRDVTKPVILDVEQLGFGPDGFGGQRGGFIARTTINRLDYGVKWNKTLDTGGAMLGDDVTIEFALEVIKEKAEG
jgi:polyisoprenoid-binding protein YceI